MQTNAKIDGITSLLK